MWENEKLFVNEKKKNKNALVDVIVYIARYTMNIQFHILYSSNWIAAVVIKTKL